jgi:hypothetical protein
MGLENVVRGIVEDMGSKSVGEFARFLRDYPDIFPMFPTLLDPVPWARNIRLCTDILRNFSSKQRDKGHTSSAIFGAFINMYMNVGSQAIGALNLAERVETWDPEHQAKLREAGVRSSFELDDDAGHVFVALSAEKYPIGIMGRCDAVGDLFVSTVVNFSYEDFATALDNMQQSGIELVLGSEAKKLLDKMDKVKRTAP